MVAPLLSLRWQVYLSTLRRSVWQMIGFAFATLYAVGFGLLAVVGLLFLGRRGEGSDDVVGVGTAPSLDGHGLDAAVFAGHLLGHAFALRHGAVRQHGLAGHVANGPDVAHRGTAMRVDGHMAPGHVQLQ